MKTTRKILSTAISLLALGQAIAAPDEEALGKSNGYPTMRNRTEYLAEGNKIGSMSNMDSVYKSNVVARGSKATAELNPMPSPPVIRWSRQGKNGTLDSVLESQRVTAVVILKGNQIVSERYQYDRTGEQKFVGFSMSKTVAAVLIGAALKDGTIKSLDDTVAQYVKELDGYDYGKVTLRNLLRMSSGMQWVEGGGPMPTADVIRLGDATYRQKGSSGGLSFVRQMKADPATPQGTKWNYSSADAEVVGLVVKGATGKSVAQYTSEKIWSKIGAEADASWNVDYSGQEATFAYFNARPRDWARFGLWLCEGFLDSVTPEFLAEMTSSDAQPDRLKVRQIYKYYGYGYQTWILPYFTNTFQLVGSWGQRIIIQPSTKTVAVILSARQTQNEDLEQFLDDLFFWQGILRSTGANASMIPEQKY